MYRVVGKRIVDLLTVFFSLIILSPVLLTISVLISIFDPGPIIFKQLRVGQDKKEFWFYKFRSMPVNTGNLASDKLGEVKFTWIGKLIRRTNLDELPQLLNILKGDMSIVGPRPPIPNQKELIALRIANQSIEIKPGLTGLAQINSFDGMSVSQKADFDGRYSKDICFVNDLKIILSTFTYLLKPPPVY